MNGEVRPPTRSTSVRLDTAGGNADDAPDGRRIETGRPGDEAGSSAERWFWFGALWLGGVATVSLLAWGIRAMILP